jgi:hypothetical protein
MEKIRKIKSEYNVMGDNNPKLFVENLKNIRRDIFGAYVDSKNFASDYVRQKLNNIGKIMDDVIEDVERESQISN